MTRTGSWAASDGCFSSQRGNPQTPYHAKRFTFKLDVGAEVVIGLSSSLDTYLYLLEGHGTEGDVRAQNDDADSTTSDSRLEVDLAAGDYTIEATTVQSRQEGSFTLTVATDIEAPVVQITGLQGSYDAIEGELLSFSFGYTPDSAAPSMAPVTPKGLALHLTSSAGAATVSGKPSLAGTYTVKFSQPGRAGSDSTTVKVVCPVGHTQQPDRSCKPSADACVLGLGTLEVGNPLSEPGMWVPSCVLPPGRRFRGGAYYAKHYTFTLEKSAAVTIDLVSDDQDTYLFLLRGHGPGNVKLRHDDDSGEGRNSRLSDVALAAGDYTISASTFGRERTGGFNVGLEIVCTTELGTLGTAWETRKGRWSASDGCVSSQRGDVGDAHNARFYTFKLAEAGDVTVELTSSADAYLYLYYGDGTAAAPLAQNDNDLAGGSTTDSRLVLRLPAGDYTIEATTRAPGAEGGFTLRAKDPELKVAATVHQPWSYTFGFVHLADSPQPEVTVTTPGLSRLTTQSEALTVRAFGADIPVVKVTVSGTPELAGDYPVTVQIDGALNPPKHSITVNAVCPARHRTLRDRSCWNYNDNPIPSDVIVPKQHWGSQKVFDVSQAALLGMIQAAQTVLPDDGDDDNDVDVSKLSYVDKKLKATIPCADAVGERYRLSRNELVAVLLSVTQHELILTSSGEPSTLVELSRYDHLNTRGDNYRLYSLNDTSSYKRAFWHPGVGLWQLDGANGYARKLNHAERANAYQGALTAAIMFMRNYCEVGLKVAYWALPEVAEANRAATFTNATAEEKSRLRVNAALRRWAWIACYDKNKEAGKRHECFDDFETMLKGAAFPSVRNTGNLAAGRLYDGRLHVRVHEYRHAPRDSDDVIAADEVYGTVRRRTVDRDGHVPENDPDGGGMTPMSCSWVDADGNTSGSSFDCVKYDIHSDDVQGFWYDHKNQNVPYTGTAGRSPLAFPFLSFTQTTSHTLTDGGVAQEATRKFVAFLHSETGYKDSDGNALDIIAAVPTDMDARGDPADSDVLLPSHRKRELYMALYDSGSGLGWWHENTVDGLRLNAEPIGARS